MSLPAEPVEAGIDLTGASARVVIINDAMAKKHWPEADALGQQIVIGKGLGPQFEEPARQIVGYGANRRWF